MAWKQMISLNRMGLSTWPELVPGAVRFFSKSASPYIVKVGIPEFLTGVGKGVETHTEKLEKDIGDFQKLLMTRTLKLKKLGIPCKHRKLILKYTHKYRLGLWRPRAEPGNHKLNS
ncbi:IGR protein motif [Dillenia turbinata]|uniref:IGR protein motif n=1 Tax=Dillenia turbinata TaxID=194707 RepID=A0AAN8UTI9_9MAGN